MERLFKNELHNEFGSWPVAFIPYGGADFGEIEAVANAVGDGGDGEFYAVWVTAAERFVAEADVALKKRHRGSARELYLRASCFFASAYHPLYGEPVDRRLVDAFRKQISAFDKGQALTLCSTHCAARTHCCSSLQQRAPPVTAR